MNEGDGLSSCEKMRERFVEWRYESFKQGEEVKDRVLAVARLSLSLLSSQFQVSRGFFALDFRLGFNHFP